MSEKPKIENSPKSKDDSQQQNEINSSQGSKGQ